MIFAYSLGGWVLHSVRDFHITKPVLLLFIIAVAILMVVFASSLYWTYKKQESDIIRNSQKQFESLFASAKEEEALSIAGILESVARIDDFQKLYKNRDRSGLIASPNFAACSAIDPIKQSFKFVGNQFMGTTS
jgi:hypothetical protein